MGLSFAEIGEELDFEFFLERESIAYKETRGSSGIQFNIRVCPSPECGDDRWRTYFGVDNGMGNCFVCGKHFNKVTFIRDHYEFGDSWRETFLVCEEIMRDQGYRPKRKAVVAVIHDDVKLPVSKPLPYEDGSVLEYLSLRGFDADICQYFGLRYCQFGLWLFKDAEGKTQTQTFNERVIIPVYDLDGTLRTFQGRDLTELSPKKYLFPMELPGTGRYLLNGHNVVATDHVVMGEGAFDVAAIKAAFDGESQLRDIVPVGSFGKHLSYGSPTGDDQLGRFLILKKRGLKFVTIMWDGESAALLAALNAGKLLAGIGLTVRIALLPQDKDPNEVEHAVVRQAFHEAKMWTPMLDLKLRLQNPYKK